MSNIYEGYNTLFVSFQISVHELEFIFCFLLTLTTIALGNEKSRVVAALVSQVV